MIYSVLNSHGVNKVIIKVKARDHYSVLVTSSNSTYEEFLGLLRTEHPSFSGLTYEDKVCKYLSLTYPALARVTGRTRRSTYKF